MSNSDPAADPDPRPAGWAAIDTGTEHLLAAQASGVLSLTLNRPEVRNAMSIPMLDALASMLGRAARSQDVRVVVLVGLALACDLRYAGTSATLRTGFGRLGLAGDFGCTWLLRRLVGPARALELLYFSEPLTAAQAQELGLVTEAVADAQLRGRVMDLARRLADAPQEALHVMKQHVTRAEGAGLADCADAEAEWHVRLVGSADHRAAVRALTRRLSASRVPDVHKSGDDES
jgi:enoyl-CoA hydratase/carnithine racemase